MVTLRQAMDRLFEDSFVRPSRFTSLFGEGAEITVTGDTLTIPKAEESKPKGVIEGEKA